MDTVEGSAAEQGSGAAAEPCNKYGRADRAGALLSRFLQGDDMHLGEFIQAVQERGRFSSAEEAEKAIHAVFNVFGSRLSIGEAEDLVEQLPWRIGDYLLHPDPPEPFGLEEFLQRVGEREGVPREDAERHARAVLSVLTEAITKEELDDVLAELPEDLRAFAKEAHEKALRGSSYEI